jgi:hypothetical protein
MKTKTAKLGLIYIFLSGIFICIILSFLWGLKEGIVGGIFIWLFLGAGEILFWVIASLIENRNAEKCLPNQFTNKDLRNINKE